jgi:hypothetical protein
VWPDDAVPLTHITNPAFEWTALAKLSPQQEQTNGKVLEILAEICKLESGPYYAGHVLRRIQDLANCPFPFPDRQTKKGVLRADMTIFDVLLQLPISKWPPARSGQCFHPECKLARTRMEKPDHPQSHYRKRNYVTNILQKLPGSIHVDGESCLSATTASLLNVMAISQKESTYSNAYKLGAGKEKHLNSHADLVNSWENNEWHMQIGDFWGPIFANLRENGGWLTLQEIFDTGFEHRFVPKPPTETESWARFVEVEEEEDNEPALMLFREVKRVYQDGQPAIDLPRDQLFDFRRIQARGQKRQELDEIEEEEFIHLDHRIAHQLTLERGAEELQPVAEVDDWNAELENAWTNFSEILPKSGLQQRVEIEAFVRNRRAQWIAMDQTQRELYNQWKIEHFVQ